MRSIQKQPCCATVSRPLQAYGVVSRPRHNGKRLCDAAGRHAPLAALAAAALLLAVAGGCQAVGVRNRVLEHSISPHASTPRELNKVTLATYVVEPPDVLLIDAVKVVPKPPQKIEPLDILTIIVVGTLGDQPISGPFAVEADGTVSLGYSYGSLKVGGLSLNQAREAISEQLKLQLNLPEVYVTLAESAGKQQINGEHLIGPDGRVNLGTYGNVRVAGMTLAQARAAIEKHLEAFLEEPEVSVDVFSYNSKVYYIITEGAGLGDQILRVPVTGNDMVLDALSQVNGLSRVSSKNIWVARPAPDGSDCEQILPVNWDAIVKGGATATNWQLMAGDRLFIAGDRLVALDSFLGKIVAPMERLFGFNLLQAQSIQASNRFPKGNFAGGFGGF